MTLPLSDLSYATHTVVVGFCIVLVLTGTYVWASSPMHDYEKKTYGVVLMIFAVLLRHWWT